MAHGEVVNEHGALMTPNSPYQSHVRVYYYRAVPNEPHIPFDEVVLFQDEHLVVVDKPHFLPVMPSGGYLAETVLVRLKRRLKIDTLVPIHRIDRDTAGLVMFSVQPSTRAAYHALFSQRRQIGRQLIQGWSLSSLFLLSHRPSACELVGFGLLLLHGPQCFTTNAVGRKAQLPHHINCYTITLTDQTQEQVFGTNVTVA